jgi:SAM-dependent methyltransferase
MARRRPSDSLRGTVDDLPRLYRDLAEWWPLLSAPEDYADEAAEYRRLIAEGADGKVSDVLELGSGGGNNASHMKTSFELTLVDRSPGMLEVSRRLNPECEHVEGDMRTVRLDRTFDAVFVHDAIAYVTSEEDLRAVFETAFVHCRPGGAALFVPDSVRETFGETTDHGGHDGEDRALRYLEWTWDPDPSDTTVRMDLTYVFHEPDGSVHAELDSHLCGLFPIDTWLGGLRDARFEPREVELTGDESRVGTLGFLAMRPASGGGRRSPRRPRPAPPAGRPRPEPRTSRVSGTSRRP